MGRKGGGAVAAAAAAVVAPLQHTITRTASTTCNKAQPIALPHDGPVCAAWQAAAISAVVAQQQQGCALQNGETTQQQRTNNNISCCGEYGSSSERCNEVSSPSESSIHVPAIVCATGAAAAAKLLMAAAVVPTTTTAAVAEAAVANSTTSSFSSYGCNNCDPAAAELLNTLTRATHIHQQLQALQAYRSKFVQQQQQQLRSVLLQEDAATCATTASQPDEAAAARTQQHDANEDITTSTNTNKNMNTPLYYRILLEWMLSADTPVTLRRAIASCLSALQQQMTNATTTTTTVPRILSSVVSSILSTTSGDNSNNNSCWKDALHSLHEALSWAPMEAMLVSNHTNNNNASPLADDSSLAAILQFLQNNTRHGMLLLLLLEHGETTATGATAVSDAALPCATNAAAATERAVLLANLINKTLILHLQVQQQQPPQGYKNHQTTTTTTRSRDDETGDDEKPQALLQECVARLQDFLWSLLPCHHSICTIRIPVDRLSSIGIAYGRTLQWQQQQQQQRQNSTTAAAAATTSAADILERAAQEMSDLGRAAVLQGLTAVLPLWSDELERLMAACKNLVVQASDPDVRLSALKGVRTLISRVNTLFEDDTSRDNDYTQQLQADLSAEVVRKLADETLQVVLQAWENPPTRKLANAIPALFESLIQLMLKFEEKRSDNGDGSNNPSLFDDLVDRLLAQPPNRKGRYLALETLLPVTGATRLIQSSSLLQDLLEGMGDHGHNTGVIADLWAKLLQQLLIEMKKSRKHSVEKQQQPDDEDKLSNPTPPLLLPQEWIDTWIPSLARSLLSVELSRRRQVAAFCLPRIVTLAGPHAVDRSDMSRAFHALLQQVERIRLSSSSEAATQHYEPLSHHRETFADRILWAQLEVTRYASRDGLLLKLANSPKALCESVATVIPPDRLRWALSHSSPTIRVAALQVMDSIVLTYGPTSASPLDRLQRELELWMYALPLAVKTDGKEYTSSVLQCLLSFLDRLALTEATAHEDLGKNGSQQASLPLFLSFVVDFLLGDVIVQKTGYPGTVAFKEAFLLSLIECIIAFSSRDHPMALDSKLMPKSAALFKRRRLDLEEDATAQIKKALLGREVFASLFSLLHSIWDNTRSAAFRVMASLVHLSRMSSLQLPEEYTGRIARVRMEARGTFLASSPRQREADTGARILAFLYHSIPAASEKAALLGRLIDLLELRLVLMKQKLAAILADDSDILSGQQLPLAHGVIHALRLVIEEDDFPLGIDENSSAGDVKGLFDRTVAHFFQAVRVSLAVIADVRDGEVVEGMDEEIAFEVGGSCAKSAKPINPGAIGANGIFSSVNRSTDEENARRLASQRIVIGSWLLAKETCGAIASLLNAKGYNADTAVYNEAGTLLISTLTSLKHTGAAFAAHRAFQLIAQVCNRKNREPALQQLPGQWASRLLAEVSKSEKIRDSTLRRSMGYSLGFLSLMRAEVSSNSHHPLCRCLLANVLKLCLPSQSQADAFAAKINLSEESKQSLFSFLVEGEQVELVSDDLYNLQTRVHALNALRSILLDAPLSQEIFPMVGVAIIASVIGYTDTEWSVRNSSTMVFAAAMVRSIDSDKNASNKDITSSNAITAHELFLSYPALSTFLLAVLKGGVLGVLGEQQTMSLPPILPILLLLTRVRSVAQSGQDSVSRVEPFITVILRCLDHKHLIIRKSAARALRNLSSGERMSKTSVLSILLTCQNHVSTSASFESIGSQGDHWNLLHGSLLTMWELVQCSSDAKVIVRESGTFEDLQTISKMYGGAPIVPLPCVMIAIEIVSAVMNKHDFDTLLGLCNGITSWLERGDLRPLDLIGAAELGAHVGLIATNAISAILWDCSFSIWEKEVYFEQLSALLRSDRIDIRLSTVKAFKKGIYRGIDSMMAQESHVEIIDGVSKVLLDALKAEIDRGAASFATDRAHPPTVRRLSRCLLECIDAEIATRNDRPLKDFHASCKMVAMSMLNRGQVLHNQAVEPESLTLTDGYGADILSFALSKEQAGESEVDSRLQSLVAQLSNPVCHWRIRHSAAVALQRFDIICEGEGEHGDFRASNSIAEDIRLEMIFTWLVLMQDEDIDVRYAAKATTKRQKSHHASFVSELSLVQEFNAIGDSLPKYQLIQALISQLLLLSDDLDMQIDAVVDEFSQSDHILHSVVSVNEGSERKIFEKENPNSYNEQCLTGQHATIGILRSAPSMAESQHIGKTQDLAGQLLCRAAMTLSRIQERVLSSDMMHEITRSNNIFPSLHNLIIGAIAVIHLGVTSNNAACEAVQKRASDILFCLAQNGSGFVIHPCIVQALHTLALAKAASSETAKSLRLCCFLIPVQF